jgi:hypothetical protein
MACNAVIREIEGASRMSPVFGLKVRPSTAMALPLSEPRKPPPLFSAWLPYLSLTVPVGIGLVTRGRGDEHFFSRISTKPGTSIAQTALRMMRTLDPLFPSPMQVVMGDGAASPKWR